MTWEKKECRVYTVGKLQELWHIRKIMTSFAVDTFNLKGEHKLRGFLEKDTNESI
jgi:hypothetical protein